MNELLSYLLHLLANADISHYSNMESKLEFNL